MNYDIVVTSGGGWRIFAATFKTLDAARSMRQVLIDRFGAEPEWRDDFAAGLTVTAVDTDKGVSLELTDLRYSFA